MRGTLSSATYRKLNIGMALGGMMLVMARRLSPVTVFNAEYLFFLPLFCGLAATTAGFTYTRSTPDTLVESEAGDAARALADMCASRASGGHGGSLSSRGRVGACRTPKVPIYLSFSLPPRLPLSQAWAPTRATSSTSWAPPRGWARSTARWRPAPSCCPSYACWSRWRSPCL